MSGNTAHRQARIARRQRRAETLADRLEHQPNCLSPTVEQVGESYATVTVRITTRKVPQEVLALIGEFGDLRIEGITAGTIEATVWL